MTQWDVSHPLVFVDQPQDEKSVALSSTKEEKKENVKSQNQLLNLKRKRLNRSQLKEAKAAWHLTPAQSNCKHKPKRQGCLVEGRWSAERYEVAEQGMLEILRAEGATFQNPISRPALRSAARKCIGDTGLLDHLLKHIEGKVAPGGAERFRRWFNTNGVMEYWLENADLVDIREQAGVQDPYWVPPSGSKGNDALCKDPVSAEELKLLKAEFGKMKSDMQELMSKKQEQYACHQTGEMFKEMVKWKAETDHNLKVILGSWKRMQEMYEELMTWKSKLEQQLGEIKSVLSSIQESKQHPPSSPQASERWEDWLESTKLDDVPGDELIPWFDSTNLVNVEQEVAMHDLYSFLPLATKPTDWPPQDSASAREIALHKEEMTNTNRDVNVGVQEVAPKKEDHVNVTPDSSTTANSILEFHNSSSLCQEMFVELFNWKAKTEQKLSEITKCVNLIRKEQS